MRNVKGAVEGRGGSEGGKIWQYQKCGKCEFNLTCLKIRKHQNIGLIGTIVHAAVTKVWLENIPGRIALTVRWDRYRRHAQKIMQIKRCSKDDADQKMLKRKCRSKWDLAEKILQIKMRTCWNQELVKEDSWGLTTISYTAEGSWRVQRQDGRGRRVRHHHPPPPPHHPHHHHHHGQVEESYTSPPTNATCPEDSPGLDGGYISLGIKVIIRKYLFWETRFILGIKVIIRKTRL